MDLLIQKVQKELITVKQVITEEVGKEALIQEPPLEVVKEIINKRRISKAPKIDYVNMKFVKYGEGRLIECIYMN